ncbi:transposase [Dactylosporangium sp. CS-047395]|uniref:transposase n=1 Tax=Dactylosporangium sp. CS-047395 TaxID=3239936 RepID=UPI003D93A3E4
MSGLRLTAIARRRGARTEAREHAIRRGEARRSALAIAEADRQLTDNKHQLATSVALVAPKLLERAGIGPVSAAQAIVSWSHAGRCRNDAAFAALAGVSPLPASSGWTTRHRLNRGGDRQLNRALYDIVTTWLRVDARTQDYAARRRAEGRSTKEIRRCLKRYIAREMFRIRPSN